MLSKRIQSLSSSMTIAISTLAAELKAEGKDILSFSAGEPDFDTPQKIKDAAVRAINEGYTKYTPVAGLPELLEAISDKLQRENNLSYSTKQIVASNGAKQSLFNLTQALINKGDEVIIPAPYWVTYPELVKYADGVPVIIQTDDKSSFKITASQLENAITKKTKMLILTTPSNPTGSVYTKPELEELAKVLIGTDIIVVSDEMYEKLVFQGSLFASIASISDDMFNRTLTVNGLSKSVAMTGWRFGYVACPNQELASKMIALQSQSTSNINSMTQIASITALNGSVNLEIEKMREAFESRAIEATKLFNQIDGLSVSQPEGAFYLFVNIKDACTDSMLFCKILLEDYGVAVIPGLAFGCDGYIRFSFATDIVTIREGIRRIEKFVKTLRANPLL